MALLPFLLLTGGVGRDSIETRPLKRVADATPGWTLSTGSIRVVGDSTPQSIRVEIYSSGRWIPALGSVVSPFLSGAAKQPRVEGLGRSQRVTLEGDNWSLKISTESGTSALQFTLTSEITRPVALPAGAILAGLEAPANGITSDQGPMSIYGGTIFGAGFPVAYQWKGGVESSFFFNVNATDWAGKTPLRRFLHSRVVAQPGETRNVLGLATSIAATFKGTGAITFEWTVTGRSNGTQPSRIEALARSVDLSEPHHPQQTVAGSLPSWERFAREHLKALWSPEGTAEAARPWNDGALGLVDPFEKIVTHPAHLGEQGGDFSTINNNLSPSILYARLNKDGVDEGLLRRQLDALPAFYDDRDEFICWSYMGHGPLAMSWQTLWFALETHRAAMAAPESWFNPAIKGRFLMGTRGLRAMAKANNYAFPQWWDSTTKLAAIQNDLPELGKVYEPWQAGQYAYLMLRAHEIDGTQWHLEEAKQSLAKLFNQVRFRVENKLYSKEFKDPADFPVTELFGNGYGAIASYKLFTLTKDITYRNYGRYFLASMLRLTPWYEDESDAIARSLKSLGLFLPHGGAYNPTPWETTEANLCIAWVLANVPEAPYRDLLVKLSNLNRVNSFDFYPANWSAVVQKHSGKDALASPYLPIEPFYSFEAPGGHTGIPILYASTTLWNYWLYEALASTDSPSIMALNLCSIEDYETALTIGDRKILLYNPGRTGKSVVVRIKHLKGNYEIDWLNKKGEKVSKRLSGLALMKGVRLDVAATSSLEVRVRNLDRREGTRVLAKTKGENALASAYAALHLGDPAKAMPFAKEFRSAVQLFRGRKYSEAERIANRIKEGVETKE